MDIHDPVEIYTLSDSVRAEVIKNYLISEGIPCFLDGLNQANQFHLTAMDVKILVEAGHADRARKLIQMHESHKHS